jgi:hypothetical protein
VYRFNRVAVCGRVGGVGSAQCFESQHLQALIVFGLQQLLCRWVDGWPAGSAPVCCTLVHPSNRHRLDPERGKLITEDVVFE